MNPCRTWFRSISAPARSFDVPHVGEVKDRITLLNIFDRTNLIRPAEGIGIFRPRMARESPSTIH